MTSTTSSAPTLELRALTKRYGARPAVDGLSFECRPGTVTGFLGPNGAGKSTMLSVIQGKLAPAVAATASWSAPPARSA